MRHAISAGHYLAAAAGFAILEAGGNAIDAGCAAGIALSVVQPDLVNFAGVAPIMIRTARGEVETIAGLGCWPQDIPADLFMREHCGRIPESVLRTVVPAAPDAWIMALERHGTLSFGEVASAAVRFAEEGFAIYPLLAQSIATRALGYRRWPQNAAIFLPDDRPPPVGAKFLQPDLARTIQYMIDQERSASGRLDGLQAARDAFYRGDIARQIVAFQRAEGGYLSMSDMARYRSALEPPPRRRWRGHELIVCGPWCQGPALLEAALLIEEVGIAGLAHNSTDYLHVVTECLDLALADREQFFGDPNFIKVPMDWLLSSDVLRARATVEVRRDSAFGRMPARTPSDADGILAADSYAPRPEADTSYVCVVDRWGNAFSATPSDSSNTSPAVPGLGIVPSFRGSQSRPDPRHPAGVAPGKRPRLTPNPAMLLPATGGVMPFGTPGGDVQVAGYAPDAR